MTSGPFLKWAGSKRAMVAQLRRHLPEPRLAIGYRQPFLGAGSPFWQIYADVRPTVLSDTNALLVNCYLVVRDHVDALVCELREHELAHGPSYYAAIRAALNEHGGPASPVQQAAYFMIVNKWGFNGLWRVNGKGSCNVPFGRTASGKSPVLCDEDTLRACSRSLDGVDIRCEAFEKTMASALEGEAVYLDPPYCPTSFTAEFTGYTAEGFSYGRHGDNERLVGALHRLDERGVAWCMSNSDCETTRVAYANWTIVEARRSGGINCDAGKRGKVGEIVVVGNARLHDYTAVSGHCDECGESEPECICEDAIAKHGQQALF